MIVALKPEITKIIGDKGINPTLPGGERETNHIRCYLNTCPEVFELKVPANIFSLAKNIELINVGGTIYAYKGRAPIDNTLGVSWLKYKRSDPRVQHTFLRYTPITGYMQFLIDGEFVLYYVIPDIAPQGEMLVHNQQKVCIPRFSEISTPLLSPEFVFSIYSNLPFEEIAIPIEQAEFIGLLTSDKQSDTQVCKKIARLVAIFNCVFEFQAIEVANTQIGSYSVARYKKAEEPIETLYGAVELKTCFNLFIGCQRNLYYATAISEVAPSTTWKDFVKQKRRGWDGFETLGLILNLTRQQFHALSGILHYLTSANRLIHLHQPENRLKFIREHLGHVVATFSGTLPMNDYMRQLLSTAVLSLSGDGSPIHDLVINQCTLRRSGAISTPIPWLSEIQLRSPKSLVGYLEKAYSQCIHIHHTPSGNVCAFVQFVPDSHIPLHNKWEISSPGAVSDSPNETILDVVNPLADPVYFYRIIRSPQIHSDSIYRYTRPRIISVPMGGQPGWKLGRRYR